MTPGYLVPIPIDQVDEAVRSAAIRRLDDLFAGGHLTLEFYSLLSDQVFAATSHSHLEAAMLGVPPVVRLTPAAQRLATRLVLDVPDGRIQLGSGWQMATDTTVRTGVGTVRIDLGAASWDALQINLRIETWGTIDILVPQGVAVQLTGGSGRIQLDSLTPPFPGAPLLRISSSGPAGVIRIRHPRVRMGDTIKRRRHLANEGRKALMAIRRQALRGINRIPR